MSRLGPRHVVSKLRRRRPAWSSKGLLLFDFRQAVEQFLIAPPVHHAVLRWHEWSGDSIPYPGLTAILVSMFVGHVAVKKWVEPVLKLLAGALVNAWTRCTAGRR